MADTIEELVAKLDAALAEVEPWDGGRVIQVGLGNYDSKRMDLSLRDLRAAALKLRECARREAQINRTLKVVETNLEEYIDGVGGTVDVTISLAFETIRAARAVGGGE